MRLNRHEAKSANRRALLEAARTLVGTHGAAVPVETIAEAADLTTGAIYSIFGSKRGLLVALVTENTARIDAFLDEVARPELTLDEAVAEYVEAWLRSYGGDTATRNLFELQVLLAAVEDERLLAQLGDSARDETRRLAGLFTDRVVDARRPRVRTTAQEAHDLAASLQAIITGFAVRESVNRQPSDLIRRSCSALTAMVGARRVADPATTSAGAPPTGSHTGEGRTR